MEDTQLDLHPQKNSLLKRKSKFTRIKYTTDSDRH